MLRELGRQTTLEARNNPRLTPRARTAAFVCTLVLAFGVFPIDAPAEEIEITDAISRELTVFNDLTPIDLTDAVSRELTAFNDLTSVDPTDAISRELTAFNDLIPIDPTDAISRELTAFNDLINPVEFTDAISREFTVFPVTAIQLGVPYQDVLATGQRLFFKITLPADRTVRFSLDHVCPTAWVTLYASFGVPPEIDKSDFVSETTTAPHAEITIPTTQAGTYYILATCAGEIPPPMGTAFSILAQDLPFGLEVVSPGIVGTGEVTLRIGGSQFSPDAAFRLLHVASGAEIVAVKTQIEDATKARARFDLSSAPMGAYSLICERPSLGRATVLPTAVSVEPAREVAVEVVGIPSPFIRSGHARNSGITQILVTNTSNVDAGVVSVYLFAPNGSDLNLSVEGGIGVPLTGSDQYVSTELWFEFLSPGEQLKLPVKIVVGPGFVGPNVQIYATATGYTRQDFRDGILNGPGGIVESLVRQLGQADDPPEFEPFVVQAIQEAVGERFDEIGLGSSAAALKGGYAVALAQQGGWRGTACGLTCELLRLDLYAACVLGVNALCAARPDWCTANPGKIAIASMYCGNKANAIADWCHICCADKCAAGCPATWGGDSDCDPNLCGGPCPGVNGCPGKCVLRRYCAERGGLSGGVGQYSYCGFKWTCVAPNCTPGGGSTDPNELAGPEGFGADRIVRAEDMLPYRVYFENLPAAMAPAAEVRVSVPLDASLDLGSLQFGDMQFGQTTVSVPTGRGSYKTVVDLSAAHGVLVEIEAGVDSAKGEAFWTLRSLDPVTGLIPENAFLGFLPPNDDSGRGEGWVSYSIRPKAGTVTRSVVRSRATIVFDFNNPISTNEVFNTIDAGVPESAIAALAAVTPGPDILLVWGGQDDAGGSGIASYAVYSSMDGGPFSVWLPSTTETSAAFRGTPGHIYSFYSIAKDNVGHVEAAPAVPDATTFVPPPGDFNGDGKTGSDDFATFKTCFTGPTVPYAPGGCTLPADSEGRIPADFDRDGDVDQVDFGVFQRCYSGTKFTDPNCAS